MGIILAKHTQNYYKKRLKNKGSRKKATKKITFFEAREKKCSKKVTTELEGWGKALVAGPLAGNLIFLRLP